MNNWNGQTRGLILMFARQEENSEMYQKPLSKYTYIKGNGDRRNKIKHLD